MHIAQGVFSCRMETILTAPNCMYGQPDVGWFGKVTYFTNNRSSDFENKYVHTLNYCFMVLLQWFYSEIIFKSTFMLILVILN